MRTIDEIWAEMTAIIDGAAGRRMTDDELTRYTVLDAELAAAQRDERVREKHAAYNTTIVPAGVPAPSPRSDGSIEDAFRSYLRTAKANADISDLAITDPSDIGMARVRNAAQSSESGPAGGYLVPEGFRTKIVERMKSVGGFSEVAENITTETGNTLPWPVIDDTANAGEVVDENEAHTSGAALGFTTQELGAHEYQSGDDAGEPIRLPWALMNDAAFDIEGLLARILGKRLARAYSPHLIHGDGVKKPKGLLHGRTGIEALGTTPSYDDLIVLKTGTDSVDGIDKEYWSGARWLLNQVSLGLIWRIKDSHGDPIWRPGQQSGALEDGTLLGHGITIDNDMPDFVGTNGAGTNWIAFGNFQLGYVVRHVRDVAIVVNPWGSAKKRQNEYTAWCRLDGRPQDVYAYSIGAGHTE